MTYVEALTEYDGAEPSLFLAGGISGTFDWQADVGARGTGSRLVRPTCGRLIGTARALSIRGMATPTVSAGYRRRLGRNEPLGVVPSGSFLFQAVRSAHLSSVHARHRFRIDRAL